ncbi:MAG TPA: hypothetical protein DDW81_00825 [Cryomorphaceae bacterium]|nr:hypothetical protein [Owenweeksia sp.]HBF18604.1 hypothetical protein [Cryomorphaceae bacterium]|tara:strand:- start:141 stop:920 length:780 start_codon:yes stop_codon:yes gene_type:complete
MRSTLLILNTLGWSAVVTVNALANILPINGYTTGELSDKYPNLFTPAGFTFSIWGVIYLGLLAFVSFSMYNARSSEKNTGTELIGLWFFISCLANVGWILAWHYQLVGLSVCIMFVLLFSLIQIYRNLGVGIRAVSPAEKYMVHAPFSIYLGWITVATVANITALLVHWNWRGWGLPANFWTAAAILLATLVALYILNRTNDFFFVLVLVWAFFGILYKREYQDPNPYPVITTTAIACGLLLLYRFFRNRAYHKNPAYF